MTVNVTDRMGRLVVLPFSSCASRSSIEVVAARPKTPKAQTKPPVTRGTRNDGNWSGEKTRNSSFGFLDHPRSSISKAMQKLIKSIKNLSQLFVYKGENEETETEMEMEIGYPTDVKHVTHIGLDGATSIHPMKDWGDLKASENISLPSISLRQFELAMAAQAMEPLVLQRSNPNFEEK